MRGKIFLAAGFILLVSVFVFYKPTQQEKTEVAKEQTSQSQQQDESEYLISVQQLKDMLAEKDFVFVNVHIPYEGEIEGTDYNIDYRRIDEFERRFDKDQKIVIYCRSGAMSANAFKKLKERGFTNVYDVQGGMIAWQEMGEKLVFKK